MKILVVDNDELILKFMNDILSKEGHRVVGAQDGLSALDIMKTYTPDIAFIDLVMPNIDGKKLIQVIRERSVSKNTYLVILSAVVAEEQPNIVKLGADACVAKGPFDQMKKNVLTFLHRIDTHASKGGMLPFDDVRPVHPRRISKELLSTKRHLEIILKKMTEGIIEITREGRIVYANPAFLSLINLPECEVLGSKFVALFPEDDRRRIEALLHRMQAKGEAIGEPCHMLLDGRQITLDILMIEEDELSFVIMVNDVTEQKRSEEALRRAHDELEELVTERTLELVKVNRDLKQEIAERMRAEEQREEYILELKGALEKVKTLKGLLPICCSCKRIRDDEGYWNQIETYISEHSEAEFTHGLCPNCAREMYNGVKPHRVEMG